MSVDYKTARHICNVIRRQIQNCFPSLYIHYVVHGENEREKKFTSDLKNLKNHPTIKYILEYPNKDFIHETLKQNKSCFSFIAYHNTHGFLGFFQQNNYLAICFINYSRFKTEKKLRNHVFHIAWHAISLYKKHYKKFHSLKKEKDKKLNFTDNDNILIPQLNNQDLYHQNLMGDIFSAGAQTLIRKENIFNDLLEQRMKDTISAEIGFFAEQFPFPICIDTIEFMYKNNISRYKKNKRPLNLAIEITEEIGITYEQTSIEQWRSFSYPAQRMAWAGHDYQTILGAALYTGENTYAQSIADIISEKLNIRPRIITTLQDNNPFTKTEANSRMHHKLCINLLNELLNQLNHPKDYKLIIKIINKQNNNLLQTKTMGWCVPALISFIKLIKDCPDISLFQNLLTEATNNFKKEISLIQWESLEYLSEIIFKYLRNNEYMTIDTLLNITSNKEELSFIYYALVQSKNLEDTD